MEPFPDFETLSQAHQFQVLRYLEMTGSENIQEAIIHLQQFNMSASQAINHKYNAQPQRYQEQYLHEDRQPHAPLNRQQQQEIIQYNNHLRQLYITTSSPWYMIKYYGGIVKSVARGLTECLMPQWARKAMFYSKFDKMYKDDSRVRLFDRGLDDAFKKGVFDEKCLAVIVGGSQKSGQIAELLNNQNQVIKLLTLRVVTVGVVENSAEFKKLKCKANSPSVVFTYATIFEEIKVLSVHKVTEITESKIQEAVTKYRDERRKEKNIIIRYKNRILMRYNGAEQDMEEEIPESGAYQNERLLIQQQTAQYEEASNIRKVSIEKQQYERVRKESLAEQRKARKISIPQQPKEGDIIVCCFRCPNGTRIDRKFDRNQKIELLYNWVETNQQIEFEDEQERKFQLLRGYPPEPMKEKMDMLIKEVIEEDRELIAIREL